MGSRAENHGFKPFTHPVGCVPSTCCKPGTQQRNRGGVMEETWPVLAFIISVQFSSVAQSCPTLCNPMDCSTPGLLSTTNSWSLLKLMFIETVMPSTISSCHPLLLLPSIFPTIRVFYNESTLRMRWAKYWSFSFSLSPSNEHPGLISFRMDWLDLLAVQGTLKSLLQHHSSKASVLLYSQTLTSIHDHWNNHSLD